MKRKKKMMRNLKVNLKVNSANERAFLNKVSLDIVRDSLILSDYAFCIHALCGLLRDDKMLNEFFGGKKNESVKND